MDVADYVHAQRFSIVSPQFLPGTASDDASGWQQTVMAFLAEKERHSGSRRMVEGYSRMIRAGSLLPFRRDCHR